MKLFKLAVLSVAVCGSSVAMADQQPVDAKDQGVIAKTTDAVTETGKTLFNTVKNPAAVSAEIGTLGYGVNVAWGINDSTELQAGWAGMDQDADFDIGDNDSWINWDKALGDSFKDFEGNMNVDADLSNPYLGVQMRPMNNWLTVGAGVLVPDNKATAVFTRDGSSSSTITFNGVDYGVENNTAITMELESKNKLAPYATLGFRPNVNNRWGMFAEVGAAYMGKFEANATVDGDISVGGTPNAAAKAVVLQETQEKLKNKADDLEWYPIVKAGVTLRF